MSISIRMDQSQVAALFDQLGDEVEAATRPAAQAAAQVLYDQVKYNVAGLGQISGNLARSIYQVYSHDHSGPGRATYHISWNHRVAPHGHLVEFGYIQRYAVYVGKDSKWHTAVRPEAQGRRRPGRRADAATKAAYYVTLPAPRQVTAQSFVRSAAIRIPQAEEAAKAELMRRI
jgi:hypothetical protein